MKFYNESDHDVAVIIYPSAGAFESGGSSILSTIDRITNDFTVKAGEHRTFHADDYISEMWFDHTRGNPYAIAVFDSEFQAAWYEVLNNLDDLVKAVYSAYGGKPSSLNQTQQGVQQIYDLLIDSPSTEHLLGFQAGIKDDNGWAVYWGREYEMKAGNGGTPDRSNPATTVHTVTGAACGTTAPSLAFFKGEYHLFYRDQNSGTILFCTASSIEGLSGNGRALPSAAGPGDAVSPYGPTAAVSSSGHQLNVFYTDQDGVVRHQRSTDAQNWTPGASASTNSAVSSAPSVMMDHSVPALAFIDFSNHVLIQRYTGSSWAPVMKGGTTLAGTGPSICVFGTKAYQFYTNTEGKIRYSSGNYDHSTGMSDQGGKHYVDSSQHTSAAPHVVAKENMLYLVFKGQSSTNVYLRHYDAVNWSRTRTLESNVHADSDVTLLDTGVFGTLFASYAYQNTARVATIQGLIS